MKKRVLITGAAGFLGKALIERLLGELPLPDPSLPWQDRLQALATGDERVSVREREIYAWYPDGIARSKLGPLPRYDAIATRSPVLAWARASVQPQSLP